MSEERYLFCDPTSAFRSVPVYQIVRAVDRIGLRGQKLNPEDDLKSLADEILSQNLDEFCWSLYFDPAFLVRLFHAGFLPIAINLGAEGDPVYCLLPKLHERRCLLVPPGDVHTSAKTKKQAKKYSFSIDTEFQRVMQACVEKHGDRSWLYRPLRNALTDLHTGRRCVHSIELWDEETGELVAGEIGYTVGAIYTSMTGFYKKTGCGNIQLAALGKFLGRQGFAVWDLGMCMDYKLEMGGIAVGRCEWLSLLRRHRDEKTELKLDGNINVRELF